jgi:hypothetical protein
VSPLRAILLGILFFLAYRTYRRYFPADKQLKPKKAAPTLKASESAIEKVDGRDPHDILGVARGASPERIRSAYQRLVKEYHPDRAATLAPEIRALAEKRTREINRAYDILTRDE